MQLKKFELSALDDEDGVSAGGQDGNNSNALVPTRPQFTNGDPKLIEEIEGEMLDASPQVSWDSVGGLTEAKRLLNEAAQVFKGEIIWAEDLMQITVGGDSQRARTQTSSQW